MGRIVPFLLDGAPVGLYWVMGTMVAVRLADLDDTAKAAKQAEVAVIQNAAQLVFTIFLTSGWPGRVDIDHATDSIVLSGTEPASQAVGQIPGIIVVFVGVFVYFSHSMYMDLRRNEWFQNKVSCVKSALGCSVAPDGDRALAEESQT